MALKKAREGRNCKSDKGGHLGLQQRGIGGGGRFEWGRRFWLGGPIGWHACFECHDARLHVNTRATTSLGRLARLSALT